MGSLTTLTFRRWMTGLTIVFLGASTECLAKLSTEDAIKRWANGPVRYLMTTQEYDVVRDLKSVPELARFITAFWVRRDPSPGTFENEYRRAYWARVIQANHRFRDSTTPGWKTDRGKVFILLGEPNEIRGDTSPSTRGAMGAPTREQIADPDRRGLERWTYRHRHSRVGRGTEFVVAFVRDESMDFKLTNDASLLQPEFPGMSTGDPNDSAFGGIEVGIGQSAVATAAGPTAPQPTLSAAPQPQVPQLDTSLLANYDLGIELAAVPSNAETVITTVSAREFLAAFKASSRFEFFRANDGNTYVNIGALVQLKDLYGDLASGVSDVRVYASISASGDSGPARYASNEAQPVRVHLGQPADPAGFLDVWAGIALPPGRYRATLAIEDSLTGRLGRTAGEFEAPDFSSPGLTVSTIVFASELSDAEGRLIVKTPRTSGKFKRSESFGLYFEVYGLKDATFFDVTYQFYRDDSGAAVKLGKPVVFTDRTQAAQAWSIPLAKWPAGSYRIEVTVSVPGGESTSTLGPFEVMEDAPPGG